MTTNDMQARIAECHAVFCRETGVTLRLGIGEYNREADWLRFLQAGFTKEDVQVVARYLRKEIIQGNRNPGALKFSNMIAQLDHLEEDLGMARAALRVKQPTPRDRVLAQARPVMAAVTPEQGQNTAVRVVDVIAAMRASAR